MRDEVSSRGGASGGMTLGRKLGLAFGVMVVLTALIGLFGMNRMGEVNDHTTAIAKRWNRWSRVCQTRGFVSACSSSRPSGRSTPLSASGRPSPNFIPDATRTAMATRAPKS